MCVKAIPATVYVALGRHLSEIKLCARPRAVIACRYFSSSQGDPTFPD